MTIDWIWLRHHGAAIISALALVCFAVIHDPATSTAFASRLGVALLIITLLYHILFPHAPPLPTESAEPGEPELSPDALFQRCAARSRRPHDLVAPPEVDPASEPAAVPPGETS